MINEDKPLGDGHLNFFMEVTVPGSVVGEDTKFAIREFVDEEWFKDSILPAEEIFDEILDNMKRKIIIGFKERLNRAK